MTGPTDKRIFSLDEARALLPEVQRLTGAAVGAAEDLAARLHDAADAAHRRQIAAEIEAVVHRWMHDIQALELEAKGLWLVDFDNGEGYYCWRHPETTIGHFHGYTEGFNGRMKIV